MKPSKNKKSYQPKISPNVKIAVFVPLSHANKVRLAIGNAGGGHIGNYSHCVFVTEGTGYFLPLKGAEPFIGKVKKISKKQNSKELEQSIEKVKEVKVEFICPKSKAPKVIKAIKAVHPYDEVAFDVFPMLNWESLQNRTVS
jgi:hypothetical protein